MGRVATFDLFRRRSALRATLAVPGARRALRHADGLVLGRWLGTGRTTAGGADLRRWVCFAVWEDIDAYAGWAPPHHSEWIERWTAVLTPRRSRGGWGGVEPFSRADCVDADGPVAVLTRARVRPARALPFMAARPAVDRVLSGAPGMLAALGMGEWPAGQQATFSVWVDADAARRFAWQQPEHTRVVERTRREGWYTEELFTTFSVGRHHGSWGGRDPMRAAVRPARPDDVSQLHAVEAQAATRFAPYALTGIDTFLDPALLATAQAEGRLWVADLGGTVVGFALALVVDGEAHLREIDVLPAHGAQGIGRRLIDEVVGWGVATGRPAMTLTTFTDVPWNAPWYARLGFIETDEWGPELGGILADERVAGLDMARRTVMRRPLP